MNKYAAHAREARKRRRAFLACESKRRWPTEDQAAQGCPVNQHTYRCRYCGGWHRASSDPDGHVRRA